MIPNKGRLFKAGMFMLLLIAGAYTFTLEAASQPLFSEREISVSHSPNGRTIHVKADATGTNNGASWADAHTDVQDGLAAATARHEILF